MESANEFVTLARVLKTQGRRGEVAAEVLSDVPDRFAVGMQLWAQGDTGTRRELKVEEFWPHKGHLVFKFFGVDSISGAEALLRSELQVPREARAVLEPGWEYVSDLAGCTVFDGSREVGQVRDVRFGAGEAPLLVVQGIREYEIPFAEAYLQNLDLKRKQIRMLLPEGLLDVNAPLTDEEKREQQRK